MKIRIIPLALIALALLSMLFAAGRGEPQGTPTPPSSPALKISPTPYKHFNGAFSIRLPEGWHVNVRDDGVLVSEPNGGAMLDVLLINTGAALDAKAINVYVDSVETNFFSVFSNYRVVERASLEQCARVSKTLESKGVAKRVISSYCYSDGVMSQQDFWMDANRAAMYSTLYDAVTGSLNVETKVVKTFVPYRERYAATDLQKRFEFQVPYSWKRETVDGIEKFTSPDEVNVLWYSSTPAESALKWLGSQFADVGVTEDRAQKDGSRRVAWNSAAGGVKGAAVITSRGTLAWIVKSGEFEKFTSFGESLLSNYQFVK
jgi:hypothetical protein